MKKICFVCTILLMQYACSVSSQDNIILKYADGSGNRYIITNDTIEYIPVKMEESSSGEYDGGEAQKKKISSDAFLQIKNKFDEIFNNKSIQIKDRIMTSGVLTIERNKKTKEVIVMKCKEQEELESLLKKALTN